MTNRFLDDLDDALNDMNNHTLTENDGVAHKTSGSSMLDFYANGGALRTRDNNSIAEIFDKAYSEDPLLATKAMFYFRDVRGGQGERRTFRILLDHCARNHPEAVVSNLPLIAEYGRWDDLYSLVDTPLEDNIWPLIDVQLAEDKVSKKPSLLAKWLASENTSSNKTKRFGRKTRVALNMSPRQYRKTLSNIRKTIGLVEHRISQGEWGGIEYDKIPSKAGLQYRKAFYRHDEERYKHFLEQVNRGEKKMNTGTLYPYDIVHQVKNGRYGQDVAALNTMWNSLPDYFNGEEVRGLVVADVSGSMEFNNGGLPMSISVSLAIYTAEHNTGPFANKYMTFSASPQLIEVPQINTTIADKVTHVMSTGIGYNTNITAVFDVILNTAVKGNMKQNELPTHLYIISDMEFDTNGVGHDMTETVFQKIRAKYEKAGYRLPFLVFWNVDSRNNQQPMSMDERGFQLVSGSSASTFVSLLANKETSAYDLMLEVLGAERYDAIRLGEW